MKFKFKKKLLGRIVFIGVILSGGTILFIGSLFAYYAATLPSPEHLATVAVAESTKIFDRNGILLYEVFGEVKRTPIPFEEIPQHTKHAAIAVEDQNFYKHVGIDPGAIARAAMINFRSGEKMQGGSTITQQFVRNAVLTRQKTVVRKLKEMILAIELETQYSKDEILSLYLNSAPHGSNTYGIEAASGAFFAKSARDLTLAESAYLIALTKAPTYYSPYGPHKPELDERAKLVLNLMQEQGYITPEEKTRAESQKVAFVPIKYNILAPHFVFYVLDELTKQYGEQTVREGGLKVTTSLDLGMQRLAEEIVGKYSAANERNNRATNAALLAMDPKTGQILAMVGSRNYFEERIDGAVNILLTDQSPGSNIKPLVYATAFENGMSPATMLFDLPTDFGRYGPGNYLPQNYDGRNHGPISIRQALQGSLNVPAVKTLTLVGLDKILDNAEEFGYTSFENRGRLGPSFTLGGGEVKPLEHIAAFGVFAQNGTKHDPQPILKIIGKNNKKLYEKSASNGRQVIDPAIAYQIAHILSDNEARMFIFSNRNNKLTLPGRPVAAKTGTSQLFTDAWTVGFTPSLVAGVWVGNNDNTPMRAGSDGLYVAAPMWNEFMRRALAGKAVEQFARPDSVIELAVDSLSGKLPTKYTPSTKKEIFAPQNVPTAYDDIHVPVTVDGETRVYTIFRSERPAEPGWELPVKRWALAHGYGYDYNSLAAALRQEIAARKQAEELANTQIPIEELFEFGDEAGGAAEAPADEFRTNAGLVKKRKFFSPSSTEGSL